MDRSSFRLEGDFGEIRWQEPLSRHTTWKLGGPARALVLPERPDQVAALLRYCQEKQIPLLVLGNGSNLLVRDSGWPGVALKLSKLQQLELSGEKIRAQAGVLLPVLARKTMAAGLAGLEWAGGIPATVGGAVLMNAGAHGGQMAEVVEKVTILNWQGEEEVWSSQELDYGYRSSRLKAARPGVVIEASFRLTPADPVQLQQRAQELLAWRQQHQPLNLPSCGSVFKNPPGGSAGRLIESAGCKGWQEGQIQVSPVHANFFVNLGGGTASEALRLMERVQARVAQVHGIKLEPEVQIVG
ncbi:UDP-N-acetylmuramate dehydrogenase [Carboxydocella sporoproducens DSM 16521]|uniref:UDP-N-acetylenolpyruvoylglucosamine reductase n=2 Tax=Carboxydocella TaxID=178898 RepID=A0A1T4M610_9FIRM|nr:MULTISPECIES: UDP-N-acetylmuramate dehydrogenase [Carboxydocella]AVX21033.1 UDP-N-acetylmuramate dehydrogenase [Carboxydocella thermautotrophica]AVX31453.1 UDP-N-acetylmuramate dehydrogenase [Carboxydocella thermautotrophica]SJZ62307.1 UDP-N-acetylmuramate dehydrogenase [Carboxydocella sporoproducens DSM 16521]